MNVFGSYGRVTDNDVTLAEGLYNYNLPRGNMGWISRVVKFRRATKLWNSVSVTVSSLAARSMRQTPSLRSNPTARCKQKSPDRSRGMLLLNMAIRSQHVVISRDAAAGPMRSFQNRLNAALRLPFSNLQTR
jgi:hypothetical protein